MKVPSQFIVVDDDSVNNLVCRYTIASFAPAARIQLFTNPGKALASIETEFGDEAEDLNATLFLDINMPEINGWEFLDAFSLFPEKLRAQINIIILSSSIDPEDLRNAENHPLVRGYYSKPLSKETLHQIYNVNNERA
ncbi:response regulator [Dyadobacter sp. CY326]|uniref:response regulator n=1 Tax=Dyadobacter sp. CY326 TaxID=2907300 RepID=UPI001F31EC77|nr:response regulator [Dyadobacter sp. CY326]MCE7065015.1 response regulator [Dyadobacter sp. CY326]